MKEFSTFPKPPVYLFNSTLRKYYRNGVFKGQKQFRRYEAFVRDGGRCLVCETKRYLTIDHIVPKIIIKTLGIQSLGYQNWQIMCETCNKEKNTEIITYRTDLRKLYAIIKYAELCMHLHRNPITMKEKNEVIIYDREHHHIRRPLLFAKF